MLESYAVRITYPKENVKHIISVWSTECEKLVAFEHTDAKKVHSHLLIINSRICKKQLRNLAAKCGVDVKGQANMSFTKYDANTTYLVYMTKGKFLPYYLQGFTQEECEEAKKQWVEPSERNPMRELYQRFESSVDLSGEEFSAYKQYVFDQKAERNVNIHFEYIRNKAHKIAFQANNQFATGKFFNDYKTLVYTYCFRNNIPIPRDWKGNY